MKALTAKESQSLDRWAIDKLGIPQIALMENAGKAVADQISQLKNRRQVLIIAYKGNNGGDGFVAARHLLNFGFEVSVFLLCHEKEIAGSAKINLDVLRKLKIPIRPNDLSALEKQLRSADVVIDAIFGLGFTGKVNGDIAQAIDLINDYRQKRHYYVVAVDVPSGINATTGKADKHSIQADLTVTFGFPKTGLLKFPAVQKVGKLIVADIGIPKKYHQDTKAPSPEFYLPKRLNWTNKGDYGKILIVAGSRNMSGAAYLAARAAIRSGAGLVYLAVPNGIQKLVASKNREVITIGLPETKEGSLSLKAFPQIMKIKADVAVIGPGLTTNSETGELVKQLIKSLKVKTLVLDADGLNSIAADLSILRRARSKIVITPHPGEMARLTGQKVAQIQKNRQKIALAMAKKWRVAVVLKGAYTIVAEGKKVAINSSGNPGMATAGAGDVLAGMIAAFVAQGLNIKDAVYLHGIAGDLAADKKGGRGLMASDLAEEIPYAIQQYQ